MSKGGIYLNIRKVIYDKTTINIIVNCEKLKAFPLRSEARQGCSLLLFLFHIVLEVLATSIRKEKERKGIQIGKKVKLSLFADDILNIENPEDAIRKPLEFMKEFSKVVTYKINTWKYVVLLYTSNKKIRKKIKQMIPLSLYHNDISLGNYSLIFLLK